jgi:hypothetical protein
MKASSEPMPMNSIQTVGSGKMERQRRSSKVEKGGWSELLSRLGREQDVYREEY